MNAVVKSETPEAAPQAATILEIISRAANDPNTDVAKTEKLLELYERIAGKNAEVAFNAAMKDCQEEMPRILRDASNTQTNSKYALLETINKAIVPVYTKHGFSLSFGSADCPLADHARITCLVSHSAGYSRSYQADVPLDLTGMKGTPNKTRTHAFGSTMSYGRRYLTLLIFNISLANEDNDGNGGENALVTEEQAANIKALLTEVGADQASFMKWAKITSLDQIPAKNYASVIKTIEAKRA